MERDDLAELVGCAPGTIDDMVACGVVGPPPWGFADAAAVAACCAACDLVGVETSDWRRCDDLCRSISSTVLGIPGDHAERDPFHPSFRDAIWVVATAHDARVCYHSTKLPMALRELGPAAVVLDLVAVIAGLAQRLT